ncbi:MAG TPA: hypothetical protein VG498_01940 [Terriglobales bacterium]|nr:hypothetical protein [Terriglobales bacterium]
MNGLLKSAAGEAHDDGSDGRTWRPEAWLANINSAADDNLSLLSAEY